MTQESWRPVARLNGLYEVSSEGNMRHRDLKVLRTRTVSRSTGYLTVGVRVGRKSRQFSVHRLVCEAFYGPAPEGHQVAHLNGVRTDPRAINLKWVTCKENQAHRIDHGTDMKGTRNPKANLSRPELENIIYRVGRLRETQAAVASDYGIAASNISLIMSGKIYGNEWGLKP